MSTTDISFYSGAVIHQPFVTWWSSPPNQISPEIFSPLPDVSQDLFFIHYCMFIFFKEPISFIGSFEKCHTSSFNALFYWGLNPFPNKPWFLRVYSRDLLKTLWEKEKLLIMSNFSFSHTVFWPFGELYAIFIKFKIVVCKLFQFGRV